MINSIMLKIKSWMRSDNTVDVSLPSTLSISCQYRVNRIIRSQWNAGLCEKYNDVLEWYYVDIDGVRHIFGILEIIDAINAVNKFESRLKENTK